MRRAGFAARSIVAAARCFQLSLVFVVVAVQAQQFPVAAVDRIVVVIVVAMMDRQFAQIGAGELAAAAASDPWINFQGPFPIALLARFGTAARVRHYPVELARIVRFRATHSNPPEGFLAVSGSVY